VRLLLVRHGHAEGGPEDPALSERGVVAMRATVAGAWPEPGCIVHSPLRRARESAALLAERWPLAERLEERAFLPEADVDAAARRLLGLAEGRETVVLVSHLPLLPALCAWFCGEPEGFEPADAVLLEAAPSLAWRGTFERIRA
jgi:phosphohistidine phosphatase SixA